MGRPIAQRVVLRTRRVRILPARIAVTQLTAAHRVGARSFFLYDCLSRLQTGKSHPGCLFLFAHCDAKYSGGHARLFVSMSIGMRA